MRILLALLLFLFSLQTSAQKYERDTVIIKARGYLEDAVGTDLIGYFHLDSASYYEYRNFLGKTKWEKILNNKRTKGNFVNADDIRFTLEHPDFLFLYESYRNVYVELDSALNLIKDINLERIPELLLPYSNTLWLTQDQIKSIASSQNLKPGVKPLSNNLSYNYYKKQYYWTVTNIIYEEEYYSICETLIIDAISGEILEHTEQRLTVIRCF